MRVFSLNITKNGNIKGNREGSNEPENGNVPENGMLNDPKNGIQNQSYNQSFNQERESRTKTGDSVPHDPGANNAVMNNFVPLGGPGQLGKFVMHEQWQPSDDFLRKSLLQGIYLDSLPTAQELAEFRIYWMAEGKAYHQAQWEQKLARRLQISRQKQSTLPDNNVPHWNSPEAWEDFL